MGKKLKRFLAMALAFIMIATCYEVPMTAKAADNNLKFDADGKFKIVVFADTQDQYPVHASLIQRMELALERENPDLVVFTGDQTELNIKEVEGDFRRTVEQILQPVVDAGVPYAFVFGNHDNQSYYSGQKTDKDAMLAVYQSIGDCRTTDPVPGLTGTGTCNIPIYSSDGSNIAFNLWMMDSNTYIDVNNTSLGHDNPHEDQLAWLQETNAALNAQEGKTINSILFQHVPMPEIYNLLAEDENGGATYNGKKYGLALNPNYATGVINEYPAPCPEQYSQGEFDVIKGMGNVLGVFTGHDHTNDFQGTYDGVTMTNVPGMTYFSYGKEEVRGYGVIELDENDLSKYDYHTVKYTTLDEEAEISRETTYDVYDEIRKIIEN